MTATLVGPLRRDADRSRHARRSDGTDVGARAPASSWASPRSTSASLVVIPLAAVLWRAIGHGWSGFWAAVTTPEARAALELTVIASIIVALVNAVMGTLIAWVIVRDHFHGKRVLDTLIDLPFALPTIVAGLVLLALYGPESPVHVTLAYTQLGVVVAPAVRHPAVRGAHRAARAARARPRHGAGGRLARRRQPDDLPPDDPAQPGAGHPRRHRAVVRPGAQRVRLDRAHLGQPAVPHRGGVGADLQPDPERQPRPGGRGVHRAAARRAAGARRRWASCSAGRCAVAERRARPGSGRGPCAVGAAASWRSSTWRSC